MAASTSADTIALFAFDLEAGGGGEVAGADEVGRGCLAGPIVAAAVVLDYSLLTVDELAPQLAGLGDSKKLTAKARERLYPLTIRQASRFAIVSAGNRTIDEQGLHITHLRILGRSRESLDSCPHVALAGCGLR